MVKIPVKFFTAALMIALFAAGAGVLAQDAKGDKAQPDPLASFDKFMTSGEIKNVTLIRTRMNSLSADTINAFNERHTGMINAYKMLSKNGHFIFETDWPLKDALRTADLMDEFMEMFIKNLGVERKDIIQCKVKLFRKHEEFSRVVASMGMGSGIGGWFRGDQCMIVGFWNPDPFYHHETTLIHESTHLANFLIQRRWNNPVPMPTWLNEGLAVLFESSFMPWAHKLQLGRNAFARLVVLKNRLNDPTVPADKKWSDMKQLMESRGPIPGYCYSEVWLITHYLCYRYGESKKKPFTEYRKFWEQVCQGKIAGTYADFEKFIYGRTNQDMKSFLDDLLKYANELTLPEMFLADGKTKVEWEITYPDTPDAREKSPKPWFIKIKNEELAKSGEGDIAATVTKSAKDSGGPAAAAGDQLTAEYAVFFDPKAEDKLAKVELKNQAGAISFEGDFLCLDVSAGIVPSEVRLKTADTADVELSVRTIIDRGSVGVRFGGAAGDFGSGYYLGLVPGFYVMQDISGLAKALSEAKDDAAKAAAQQKFTQKIAAAIQPGQDYTIVFRIKDGTASVCSYKGDVLAKFPVPELKPGAISVHIPPGSKVRITDLKAKKP